MPVFQYSALDAQGVEVKDEIEALSQKEAISKIRDIFPRRFVPVRRRRKREQEPAQNLLKGVVPVVRSKSKPSLSLHDSFRRSRTRACRFYDPSGFLKSSKSQGHSRRLLATFPMTSKAARRFRRHWPGTQGPLIGCWSVWWRPARPAACLT